jgi:hypothetical protein
MLLRVELEKLANANIKLLVSTQNHIVTVYWQ